MAQTTTQIGRMKVAHPDLGYDTADGGINLHAALNTMFKAFSDHSISRYFSVTVGNGSTVNITHNFAMGLSSITVFLYQGSTLIQAGSSATWTVTEVDTNTISVTNNSGSSQTIQVNIVAYDMISVLESASTKSANGIALDGVRLKDGAITQDTATLSKSGYSATIASGTLYKLGELTMSGNSQHLLLRIKIWSSSGADSGVTECDVVVRSNTLPSKDVRFVVTRYINTRFVEIQVWNDTASGRVAIGYTTTAASQSVRWEVTEIDRTLYAFWQNSTSLEILSTAGLTQINETGYFETNRPFTFSGGINTDLISEKTSGSGVTIDGVLLKDNSVAASSLTANYALYAGTGGLISSEQYLAKTRGGTGITSTATFPASGTIATLEATQTFTAIQTFSENIVLSSTKEINSGTSYVKIKGGNGAFFVASGYVGEVILFTSRGVSCPSGGYGSNTSPLATITPGVWILYFQGSFSAVNTANKVSFWLSVTSAAGGGDVIYYDPSISGAAEYVNNQNASASGLATVPGHPIPYRFGVSTPIYAKGYAEDAAVVITITGYAIRIA